MSKKLLKSKSCWIAGGIGSKASACGSIQFDPETKKLTVTGGFTSATGEHRSKKTKTLTLTSEGVINNYLVGSLCLDTFHFWGAFIEVLESSPELLKELNKHVKYPLTSDTSWSSAWYRIPRRWSRLAEAPWEVQMAKKIYYQKGYNEN